MSPDTVPISRRHPEATLMGNHPIVAVIIPTRNRKDILLRTLESVLRQSVPHEVHVLDDASEDGTAQVVRDIFPQVHVHREEHPHGPTFQRNKGVALSSAPYLFTLDDDCIMPHDDLCREVLAEFSHPRIGAVTIPFVNIDEVGCVRSAAPGPGILATFDYWGGMIAFRRDVYLSAGGYRSELFMAGEEQDLAVRILDRGYVIRLGSATPLTHHRSPIRNTTRVQTLTMRNLVLYSWFNVPMPYLCGHLPVTVLNGLRWGLSNRLPLLTVRGLIRGFLDIVRLRHVRKPVSRQVYRLSRRLRTRGVMSLEEMQSQLPAISEP